MKKQILFLLISGASFIGFAQTTMNFESWTGSGAAIEPAGWISENALTGIGNAQSAFRDTAPNIHAGTYALKLVSVDMFINPAPASLPDPIGLAATGNLAGTALKFGFPYTGRPTMADFWYKYAPTSSGDTASFFLALWNGTTGDTVSYGFWKSGTAVSSYTQQSVVLTHDPAHLNVTPDSMAIIFSSTRLFNPDYSFCLNCGKAGSILWVDDITFSGTSGIKENLHADGVTLFPNPASESLNISVDALDAAFSVSAFDATGRIISTTALSSSAGMNSKSAVINTSGLSTGLYSYIVNNKKGTSLRAGKFSVVR